MKNLPQCKTVDSPQFWQSTSESPTQIRPRGLREFDLFNITRSSQQPSSYSHSGYAPVLELDAAATPKQDPLEETPHSFLHTWKFFLLTVSVQILWCRFCDSFNRRATAARKRRLKHRPNLKRDKHQEKAAIGKKSTKEDERWSYITACVLPQFLWSFVLSLVRDDKVDKVFNGTISIMIIAYWFLDSRLQRLRIEVQVEEDEEARPPEKSELDMRTLRKYTQYLVRRLIKTSVRSAAEAAPTRDPTAKAADPAPLQNLASSTILALWLWTELQTPRPRRRHSGVDK